MNKIDKSALARDMLKWEQYQRAADELAASIRDTVLQLGETVVTGNVRATYRDGRKTYDRPAALYPEMAPVDRAWAARQDYPEYATEHTTYKVDWVGLTKSLGAENIPYTESGPSVSLKLEG